MRIGAKFSYKEGEMLSVQALAKRFEFTFREFLFQIGMKAARSLYFEKLSKILRPRSFSSTGGPLSASGRRMVSFSVNNLDNLVIIRSYPLNVYRTGPGPRTAKRTEGLKILRSFQKSFNASMAAADVIEKMSKDGKGLFSLASTKKWETRLHRSNSRRSGEI